MASGINSWSTTAATNATADSTIGWAEGMAPSGVNDSARAMMARIAEWRDGINGSNVTAGTSTVYTLTSDQSFASLAAGQEIAFQLDETNGATVTINVDGLGAKPLRSAAGVELLAGALLVGSVHRATYFTSNSGEWLLHGYPVLGDAQIAAAKLASNSVTTAKILDDNVTLAKLVNASAQYKILARKTAAAGDWEECSITELLDFAGAGDGSSANGDILYRDTTWKSLPKGTDAQTLILASGLPSWANQTTAKLAAATASASASLSFTSLIDSAYRKYVFEIDNLLPATDDVQLICEVSDDAGGSWKATSYIQQLVMIDTGGSATGASGTTAINLSLAGGSTVGVDNGAGYGWSGSVELITPSNTTTRKTINVLTGCYLRAGGAVTQHVTGGGGFWNGGNGAITGIRFRYSSGNIASGTITMYGVAG